MWETGSTMVPCRAKGSSGPPSGAACPKPRRGQEPARVLGSGPSDYGRNAARSARTASATSGAPITAPTTATPAAPEPWTTPGAF